MDKVQKEIKRLERQAAAMAKCEAFIHASILMFKEEDFSLGEGVSCAVSLLGTLMTGVNNNRERKEEIMADIEALVDKYLTR